MLEEKIDALTKEIVALRQALEKGGAAASSEKAKPAASKAKAKPAADEDDEDDEAPKAKAKPAAKAKAKPAKEGPEHDEDEVGAIFRKAAKLDKPRCKKYLAKVDCEDLAELLTDEDKFDAAYAFAEKVIADAEDEDGEDD